MRLATTVAVLVCLWVIGAHAFVVDQHNDQETPGGGWNISNPPMGQEFRPTMDHFDAAELYVFCGSTIAYPTEFTIEVYEWDVLGSPLSVSDTVSVTADYEGPIMFRFPGSVPLIPLATYVLVVYELGGEGWGLGCTGNDYYWGTLIVWGEPQPWYDAWFREGSLATPVEGGSWGSIKSLYRDSSE